MLNCPHIKTLLPTNVLDGEQVAWSRQRIRSALAVPIIPPPPGRGRRARAQQQHPARGRPATRRPAPRPSWHLYPVPNPTEVSHEQRLAD
jgi:hypothetical protein